MKHIILVLLSVGITACTTPKPYENTIRPDGEWKAVNPEYFGKDEAARIREGHLKF